MGKVSRSDAGKPKGARPLFAWCLKGAWPLLVPTLLFANDMPGPLVIADFNSGKKPNNLGQEWGAWNFDPSDPEQECLDGIEADDFENPNSGHALRLDYDVQSSKPAFNGFWMKLGALDASPYEWLSFYVRGGADGKFTKRLKIELKTKQGERASYLVQVLSSQWQGVRIPFRKNPAVTDWTQVSEFVVVFDDVLATYKKGTVFFDQIEFQK